MFVVGDLIGRLAVLAVAIAAICGAIAWISRARPPAFLRGVLAGTGLVLIVDIVWVHWVFGLHHLTNNAEDVILEPAIVAACVVLVWYALTREPRR